MNNLEVIDSNLRKLEDLIESVNSYYQYASRSFFSKFGEEELQNFKKLKNHIDKIEIEIVNSSNMILGYITKDKRLEQGLEILVKNKNYSHIKELPNMSNLTNLTLKTKSLDNNNTELESIILKWADNPIDATKEITNYNNSLLLFRALQNEQYELMGNLSKAMYLFFNYENSSRVLKSHIIKLNLKPLKF